MGRAADRARNDVVSLGGIKETGKVPAVPHTKYEKGARLNEGKREAKGGSVTGQSRTT